MVNRDKDFHVSVGNGVKGAAEVEDVNAFRDKGKCFVELGFQHWPAAARRKVEGYNDGGAVRRLTERGKIVSE